jgi:hypothetical protein
MKKAFFVIAVPALLVAMGLAQTPAPSSNTDQTNIKGCLGGSDGNYTVVEDNTGHIFKITTSSVDLKPHLSHDVTLIGHKASAVSSGAADNNFAVTELNMISEHCAAAAASSAATVSTPSEIASTPAAAATAPAATVSPLPETAVAPAAPATPPAETTVVTPAAPATPPAEAVGAPAPATPPAETVATPAADATPPPAAITPAAVAAAPVATVSTPSESASKPAAHHRSRSAAPAAATTAAAAGASSSEHASKAVSAGTPPSDTPPVAASSSPETASAPAAVATTPTATSRGWSLWLLIAFGVLILVLGTMFPFFSRWRKRKSLERTDAPNLSLIGDASPDQSKSYSAKRDQDKIDPPVTRKAA